MKLIRTEMNAGTAAIIVTHDERMTHSRGSHSPHY